MSLVLSTSDNNKTLSLDKSERSIGSDPSCDLYLPNTGISAKHAVIRLEAGLTWLIRPSQATGIVHVNGRLISAAALLHAGDDVHFDSISFRVKSAEPFQLIKTGAHAGMATHFSERIVLRLLTGPETGSAYALINSLCIGRSSLSDIQVDDSTLAERQVLIQRQGNDVVVKNLSPVLEMLVDGWPCNEGILAVGSQLCIDQHRYILQSSCTDFAQQIDVPNVKVVNQPEVQAETLPAEPLNAAIFTRSQWILLASAVLISGILILLLTIAP